MSNPENESWVDEQSDQVDSWWGAVAALALLQSYNFILLQGLIHITAFEPVSLVFFIVIALSQAGGLRVMNRYLKTHRWQEALSFWRSPVEMLKCVAAIAFAGLYVYLLTGHLPFPQDPSLYRDVGMVGNLAFQFFNLGISFLLNWLWKMSPKVAEMRGASGLPDDRGRGFLAVLIAIPLGVGLVVLSCYVKELFYVLGVIGYGAITLAVSAALTQNPRSRGT